jgi:hypothetical protein
MKTYWGSGGIDPSILSLGTSWRFLVSFTPRPLYLRGKSPWIGGWVDHKAGKDSVAKRKKNFPCRE